LLVHLPRPYLAASELTPLPEGMDVKSFSLEGMLVRSDGICVKVQKFPGPDQKEIFKFFTSWSSVL
jgi:hypothetical protein